MSVRETAARAFDVLKKRRLAYLFTFKRDPNLKAQPRVRKWKWGAMRRAYEYIFLGNYAAQEVLIDLATFCRASETTFHPDARVNAVLEGRREVWLRIANHLNLSSEQLFALYRGHQFNAASRDLSENEE